MEKILKQPRNPGKRRGRKLSRFKPKTKLEDMAEVNLVSTGSYRFLILDIRDTVRAKHKKIIYADRCELTMPRPCSEEILQDYIQHRLPQNMIVRDTRGGGRIWHDEKILVAFGSSAYGQANPRLVKELLQDYASRRQKRLEVMMGRTYIPPLDDEW